MDPHPNCIDERPTEKTTLNMPRCTAPANTGLPAWRDQQEVDESCRMHRMRVPGGPSKPTPYRQCPVGFLLMRVVSLLPSATELLCALGAEAMLVGRSHECDHPPEVRDRPVLTAQRTNAATSAAIDEQVRSTMESGGSLYTLDEDRLRSLEPDVILTQDLCEVCSIDLASVNRVAATMDPAPKIVNLDPKTIFDVFDDVLKVARAVGLEAEGDRKMVELRGRYWEAIDYVTPYIRQPEVAFLEWLDPPFSGGHWTPGLIEAAGGRHSLNAAGRPSRQVTPEEIVESMPDRLILCPCGFDLARIEAELDTVRNSSWWKVLPAVQEGRVVMVDGHEMFNRPGPRLVDAFCWLVSWIQDRPEVLPPDFPVRVV